MELFKDVLPDKLRRRMTHDPVAPSDLMDEIIASASDGAEREMEVVTRFLQLVASNTSVSTGAGGNQQDSTSGLEVAPSGDDEISGFDVPAILVYNTSQALPQRGRPLLVYFTGDTIQRGEAR